VTSLLWPSPKVILKGEVIEIRNVDGSLHIARKAKYHDEWDPPVPEYDPYGPGQPVIDDEDGGDIDVVYDNVTSDSVT
jgi:hypothetical protein